MGPCVLLQGVRLCDPTEPAYCNLSSARPQTSIVNLKAREPEALNRQRLKPETPEQKILLVVNKEY